MWITLTEAFVLESLTGLELKALKEKALASGQASPLPGSITKVVREVRGYVAANPANTLGEGETIPDELQTAAISRIRFELCTRLPIASLLTEDRRAANKDALSLFRDVAAGRFVIEQPATASDEVSASPGGAQLVSSKPSRVSRDRMKGL